MSSIEKSAANHRPLSHRRCPICTEEASITPNPRLGVHSPSQLSIANQQHRLAAPSLAVRVVCVCIADTRSERILALFESRRVVSDCVCVPDRVNRPLCPVPVGSPVLFSRAHSSILPGRLKSRTSGRCSVWSSSASKKQTALASQPAAFTLSIFFELTPHLTLPHPQHNKVAASCTLVQPTFHSLPPQASKRLHLLPSPHSTGCYIGQDRPATRARHKLYVR